MGASDPFTGREFGGLRIGERLGQGGMGAVYRATQVKLDRPVAVKLLDGVPDLRRGTHRERFLREARTAARLAHPHIVQVHDVDEVEGVPYLVMELVQGPSLERVVAERGALPERDALAIALQVAEGLRAAHDAGVVHRDIKPGNVLLDPHGNVKIADFGLAKGLEPDGPMLTREGQVLGTPAYMAPEQIEGRPCDHRADLFSLGATLFELVTGRRAFSGDTPIGVISQRLKVERIDLGLDPTQLTLGLRVLLRRLMSVKPEERPPSASAVADEIRRLLGVPAMTAPGVPHLARPSLPPAPTPLPAAVPEATPAPIPSRAVGSPGGRIVSRPRRAGRGPRVPTGLLAGGLVGVVALVGVLVWAGTGGRTNSGRSPDGARGWDQDLRAATTAPATKSILADLASLQQRARNAPGPEIDGLLDAYERLLAGPDVAADGEVRATASRELDALRQKQHQWLQEQEAAAALAAAETLERDGATEEAEEGYRGVIRDHPGTPAGTRANERYRALEAAREMERLFSEIELEFEAGRLDRARLDLTKLEVLRADAARIEHLRVRLDGEVRITEGLVRAEELAADGKTEEAIRLLRGLPDSDARVRRALSALAAHTDTAGKRAPGPTLDAWNFEWPAKPISASVFRASGDPITGVLRAGDAGTGRLVVAGKEIVLPSESVLAWHAARQPAALKARPGIRLTLEATGKRQLIGIVVRTTPSALRLRLASGETDVLRADVVAVQAVERLPADPCRQCNGLGRAMGMAACQECDRAGRANCKNCTKGSWHDCPRHVEENCELCAGKGKVRVVRCGECNGNGHKLEVRIRGARWVRERVDCGHCNKLGVIMCKVCRALGTVPCTKCKSTGQVPAEVSCNSCGGTGAATGAPGAGDAAVEPFSLRLALTDPDASTLQRSEAWRPAAS